MDVHCDEIDDEQSRFIETLATLALERGIGRRVTASHTTAMHSYNGAYASRLFRLLKMADLNFVANPLVNIHLQGRFDTYPKRRGITRVKEMLEANINVCFGHDDVFDPWYPMGSANMLQVLHMGLHVCQIMGYEQINDGLKLISSHSARTLNVQDRYGIEVGKPANLLIPACRQRLRCGAPSGAGALLDPPRQGDCPDPPGPDRNPVEPTRAYRFPALRLSIWCSADEFHLWAQGPPLRHNGGLTLRE